MKKLTFAIVCAALLAACTKENLETGSTQTAVEVTLSAVAEQQIDENATKTGLGSGNTIVWKSGDKLSVLSNISSTSNNDEFTLTTGAEAVSGTFNGTLTEGADQYYALYPYSSEASYDGTTISFALPQSQTYAAGSFGNGANPSVAAFTNPASSLSFKNICGVFKLALTGSVTVEKIALSDDSGKMIWGDASLTADASIGTDSQTLTLADGNNTIWLNDINATLTSTATNFYFVAPKGAFASGFTAYVYANGKIYTYLSSAKSNTVARSKVMAMPTAAVATPASKDLGENSNCFIVPCAGTYTFTANQGKGGATVSPATVEVLWETANTTTVPTVGDIVNTVSASGSTISFTASGTAGNALIAAKDGSGNIIWSWHIWVPESPVEIKQYATTAAPFVMDRNLGAINKTVSDPKSAGMLYEWGRKDPFMGTGSLTSDYVRIASTAANPSAFISYDDEVNRTVEYAIAHPTEFIHGNGDWLSTSNNNLWGVNKTIYDPCPLGYQVSNFSDCLDLRHTEKDLTMGGAFIDNTEWYPSTGYFGQKNVSTIRLVTSLGGIWIWYYSNYGNAYAYKLSYRSTDGEFVRGNDSKSSAFAVRCVKE